jgi:hypothetical protein
MSNAYSDRNWEQTAQARQFCANSAPQSPFFRCIAPISSATAEFHLAAKARGTQMMSRKHPLRGDAAHTMFALRVLLARRASHQGDNFSLEGAVLEPRDQFGGRASQEFLELLGQLASQHDLAPGKDLVQFG